TNERSDHRDALPSIAWFLETVRRSGSSDRIRDRVFTCCAMTTRLSFYSRGRLPQMKSSIGCATDREPSNCGEVRRARPAHEMTLGRLLTSGCKNDRAMSTHPVKVDVALLALDPDVLIWGGVDVAGDESDTGFPDPRPDAVQGHVLPDPRDNDLVEDKLLDAVEEPLALLAAGLDRLLSDVPIA